MKILYHHRTQARDGCIVHITEIIDGLRRLGHEVMVVAPPGWGQGLTAAGRGNGLVEHLRRMLPSSAFELLEALYALHDYRKLRRACRLHRPDVIYERYNIFTPGGAWVRRGMGIPLILEVNAPMYQERCAHGGLSLKRLARWTERTAWLAADRVLPVTEVLAGHLRAAGVADSRIEVVPNGINPRQFPSVPDSAAAKASLGLQDRVVLGFSGFMRDWHRLDEVVEVLADDALGGRGHLLIVGDGPARAAVEARARTLGVAGRVTITGVLPHDRMVSYIGAFDVALQPAVTPYASPLKMFEYMQLGRAIVAPDMPNMREILTAGQTALLFQADSLQDCRRCIVRLCRNPGLRERLGTAAHASVAERGYTWDRNARRIAVLSEALLNPTAASADEVRSALI